MGMDYTTQSMPGTESWDLLLEPLSDPLYPWNLSVSAPMFPATDTPSELISQAPQPKG